jgi:hypothetical protein
MVRKCSILTMACATVLACGGVASADKAVVSGVVEAPKAAMSLRDAVQNWSNTAGVYNSVGSCNCLWFNGAFDGRNGQLSHLGGAVNNGAKAFDDFYLCEGFVYDLVSVSGTLITNSIPSINKAAAEIWSDCDGCPAELLYTLVNGTPTVIGPYAHDASFRVVDWTFAVANQPATVNNQPNPARNIVLKGGIYWLSLYGLTDGQCCTMWMCDSTYWGTTDVLKGNVPKVRFGSQIGPCSTQYSFSGPCLAIDECCISCTDLAFEICATPCKILVDNGVPDRTSTPAGSQSQYATNNLTANNRSADDFVTPPCGQFQICYIEGCVYTNCLPDRFKGVFDLYGNDCRLPSYSFGSASLLPAGPIQATKVIDLGYNVTFDGKSLRAYKLEFHKLNIVLAGGRQYWLSLGVQASYLINERALFCFNADCDRVCLVRWNAGAFLPAGHQTVWQSTGRDFSFLVAGDKVTTGTGDSTGTCRADFNADGAVSTQDIFDYLTSWFAGCN